MTRTGRIHHVELYVGSLKASRAFWEPFLEQLGYRRYQTWEGGVSFYLDPSYLVLVEVEPAHRAAGYHRKRIGLNHIAFHANSRAQVDDLTDWVVANGYTLLYPERHPYAAGPNYYALFCEDPDRIKVEVVAP
ncbi:MAG TPA: hypothetical protein ENK37_11250 [Oceanithermus profundus]|uniref:VOC domain-containing protein n=1 Tax=Oceanithermus profundus TaxID=187137 RepID=A0A7C4V783_9DEIN|nr:hypothetical protein [Oceanithermus profundus]